MDRLRRLAVYSGGQTGVDRAALDVALLLHLKCGGWCPRGRRAEDGVIPPRYPLRETPSGSYAQRTRWNVRDSDATLILNRGSLEGGTALTQRIALESAKPCRLVGLEENPDPALIGAWLADNRVRVLNIAGPRESGRPGIQRQAHDWLLRLLAVMRA
ncbi:MAG: putative molybdenum carrier protein [Pseudomonadota bacterium]